MSSLPVPVSPTMRMVLFIGAIAEGLRAWQVRKLYRSNGFRPDPANPATAIDGVRRAMRATYQREMDHLESHLSFLASTVHPAVAQGPERVAEAWRIAEKKLSGKQWCVGEKYSIADIHLFRLYWRLKTALELPKGALSNLAAHHERMMARPAVQKTIRIESEIGYELPEWFPGKTPA